jgi:hypothetical protein
MQSIDTIKLAIVNYAHCRSDGWIARKLNTSSNIVRHVRTFHLSFYRKKNLGAKKMDLESYLKENYLTESDPDVAVKFGVSPYRVSMTRKALGLIKSKRASSQILNFVEQHGEGRTSGEVYDLAIASGIKCERKYITNVMIRFGFGESREKKEIVVTYNSQASWNPSHDMIEKDISDPAKDGLKKLMFGGLV